MNGPGFLSAALARLPAGIVGRRLGTRAGLIIGSSLVVGGLSLLPFGPIFFEQWQSGWILGTNTVAWAGAVFYHTNVILLLMGATTDSERHHAFSLKEAIIYASGKDCS